MAITDFSLWMSVLDMDDFEEVNSLYQSVKTVSDYGLYRTVKGNKEGSYIVTASYIDEQLFLASEEARDTFLRMIENKYCGGEPEEIWYAVERANAKDD